MTTHVHDIMRSYIEALGGQLLLIAEFPDREPVALSGLSTMETAPRRTRCPSRLRRMRTHATQS